MSVRAFRRSGKAETASPVSASSLHERTTLVIATIRISGLIAYISLPKLTRINIEPLQEH